MKLNLQQVTDITLGADRVTEEVNGYHFYRFTQEQEKCYEGRKEDYNKKVLSTTGVQLSFRTNSETLFLNINVRPGSNRTYFAMDIFVNGERVDFIRNFTKAEDLEDLEYASLTLPLGDFEKTIDLGKGEKIVRIDFPWSMETMIREIALTEGATLEPIKPENKMLVFGDSITQGYDALHPSNTYISKLANYLNAEVYNKAIGGEVFFPELAVPAENFTPDYIVVAYGTNDWNTAKTKEEFVENCESFFKNLTNNYPDTPVLLITPTWRGEWQEARPTGTFESVDGLMRSVAEDYDNVSVVTGINFIEHDIMLFADRRIHPNDAGFQQYFESLKDALPASWKQN